MSTLYSQLGICKVTGLEILAPIGRIDRGEEMAGTDQIYVSR